MNKPWIKSMVGEDYRESRIVFQFWAALLRGPLNFAWGQQTLHTPIPNLNPKRVRPSHVQAWHPFRNTPLFLTLSLSLSLKHTQVQTNILAYTRTHSNTHTHTHKTHKLLRHRFQLWEKLASSDKKKLNFAADWLRLQ